MIDLNFGTWLAENLLPPKPDPRLSAYPLMDKWTPTALISLTYVVGVYAWRAEIIRRKNTMKQTKSNEKHLEKSPSINYDFCTYFMVFYNLSMVVYSTYMTFGSLLLTYRLGYGLGCIESPNPNDRRTDGLVYFGYLYFFSKFIEMLDTVFFLWRGKVDQVTFLHVFHHASMPPSVWWGLKYAPGGIVYMFPIVNSFIHIIMYTYYGLAAIGAYKYLWWKNYLTLAQMIQFLFLIIHQSQIFFPSTTCNYPKVFPAAIMIYATIFLFLFSNFYRKAYWRKQRLAKTENKRLEQFKKPYTCNELEQTMPNLHKKNKQFTTVSNYQNCKTNINEEKKRD